MLAALHEALDEIAEDPEVARRDPGRRRPRLLRRARPERDAGGRGRPRTGGAACFADLFARCAARDDRGSATLPQPVIAEVRGLATAAGCQLVATCDLAVAAEGARFGVNGVNIGLFCSTPMVALTRNVAAQGGVRDAGDRPLRRRRGGAAPWPRQPRRAGGRPARPRRTSWPTTIAGKLWRGGADRQAAVPRPGRPDRAGRLCACRRGDGREHAAGATPTRASQASWKSAAEWRPDRGRAASAAVSVRRADRPWLGQAGRRYQ